jgi:hypothetical protein
MSLDEAIKLLKERKEINWHLVDGNESSEFGIFIMKEIKAIEVVLQAVEHGTL